jgi:ParB/RepB/Spo0J family partition protein
MNIQEIDIGNLFISEFNVRKSDINEDKLINNLKDNIRDKGLLNPLTVRYNTKTEKYDILAGQRRFKALQKMSSKLVSCNVLDPNLSEKKQLIISFTENMQRKQMTLCDIVKTCGLFKNKYKNEKTDISKVLNIDANIINKYLSITHLPDSILNRLDKTKSEKISLDYAYNLGRLEITDEEELQQLVTLLDNVSNTTRVEIIKKIINHGKYGGYNFEEYINHAKKIKKEVQKQKDNKDDLTRAVNNVFKPDSNNTKNDKPKSEKSYNKKIQQIKSKKGLHIECKTRNPQLQCLYRKQLITRYNKCIISGMGINVCEACHIIPFSESDNATNFNLNNGLILNKILHKLFDDYYLSINPDTLCVEIFDKYEDYDYIKQYDKMKIDKLHSYKKTITYLRLHYAIFKTKRVI